MILSTLLILAPFFLEGAGIVTNRSYFIYYYLLLPTIFYLYAFLSKKKLVFPTTAGLFFILFLLISLLSSLNFSVDRQQSFELWLFYLAVFLLFIFFYNFKTAADRVIRIAVFLGGAVFIILNLTKPFLPVDEYNLFYPTYMFHNHLGDLIGLTMVYFLYSYFESRKKIYLGLFIVALPFLLTSFSRSAYLAFIFTVGILFIWLRGSLENKTKNRVIFFGLLTVIVIYLLSLVIARGLDEKSRVVKMTEGIVSRLNLPKKDFISSRPEFFYQALRSFQKNPWFGVGPGNFIYASQQNQDKYFAWSDNAHNIFLDTLVENGLPATLFFLGYILIVLRSALKSKSFAALGFLYFLLIFQTDYVYKFYSLFVLFFILASAFHEEKNSQEATSLFGVMAILVALMVNAIMINKILIKSGQFGLAQKIYPFNKEVYIPLINQALKNEDYDKALNWAQAYFSIAPADVLAQSTLADLNIALGEEDAGLELYENIYKNNHYLAFPLIENLYFLKKERESTRSASLFIKEVLKNYKKKLRYSYYLGEQIRVFCRNENRSFCRQTGWTK